MSHVTAQYLHVAAQCPHMAAHCLHVAFRCPHVAAQCPHETAGCPQVTARGAVGIVGAGAALTLACRAATSSAGTSGAFS